MPPDANERRPRAESGALDITRGDGDKGSITVPRWTGCPCGCITKLPWIDDEDCARHRPIGEPRNWGGYSVVTLGLAPHDRERCEPCQAVGR